MASEKQIAANRQNAQKSTGPRTKPGKARSARNALKHGLSAEQVIMPGEDPAAFEALRDDLHAHYQPADPVAENLVEQVAATIWRLRRVPKTEAGIYSYFRLKLESRQADIRMAAQQVDSFDESLKLFTEIRDEKAFGAAEHDKKRLEAKLQTEKPVMGAVFCDSERSLSSLARIAATIEGSMYRAIRELDRRVAERQDASDSDPVIDVEADEVEPSKPRLIQS